MKVAKWLALGAGVTGAAVVLAVVVAVFIGYTAYKADSPGWVGVADKTLWDWLDLLIVPTVLAIGGYLFTQAERQATEAAAERRGRGSANSVSRPDETT
jgi:hypothetical protein